ncbi:uncharacterized protein KGF55_003559 [Candida pseudojiufengensis]|uniref:uncharacterized protein n=1 Tax=Candida pseudojiufengensis TaxID=497109 RepID=UPI002224383C|nr:uncharacterized protein KGF55_003559 [Candida pseudojiufengensis]KAI5962483.1 hypothetical protein KGF55_003559 [Candida pseudojiufengensis]
MSSTDSSSLKDTVSKVQGSLDHKQPEDQESNLRYAAYANRIRTILLASHRYVAYTSDIGESFRPVAHPWIVKTGYAISWLYLIGDVSYAAWMTNLKSQGRYVPGLKPWDPAPAPNLIAAETFKETHSPIDSDWKIVAVKRGVFQSIASMGLPAFTIHSAVRYSSILFKNAAKPLKTYGPVGVGLAIVPALPYIFDEPTEHVVDYIFDKGYEYYKKEKLN